MNSGFIGGQAASSAVSGQCRSRGENPGQPSPLSLIHPLGGTVRDSEFFLPILCEFYGMARAPIRVVV